MLETRKLSVGYGKHHALEDVSIRVERGEIVVILGANGAGKSTLLRAIAGLCEGTVQGDVTIDGVPLQDLPAHRIVGHGVALVPEGRGVFGDLTVMENLLLGAYADHARADQQANLDRVFRLFPKLVERREQAVRTMSGGEQQMVAIGRAMMSSPSILMLDEPSLGLSPLLCKELFHSLKEVRAAGLGILLVEQNARQSLAVADRGYLLENGRIVGEGSAARLRDDPGVQAAYLGGSVPSEGRSSERLRGEQAVGESARSRIPFTPPQRRPVAVAADALLNERIEDLVARASDAQRRYRDTRPGLEREAPQRGAAAEKHEDRLEALLKEIEQAAIRARSAGSGRAEG
ncbi:MAG: hypothetical protein Kow006_22400 [Gammaproteobacteria bacterium]